MNLFKPNYLPEHWPIPSIPPLEEKPMGWMQDIFHQWRYDWSSLLTDFRRDWDFDETKFNRLMNTLAHTTSIDDVAVFRLDLTFTKDYRLDDYGVFMGLVKRLNDVIHEREDIADGLCFIASVVEHAPDTGLHLHLLLVYRWEVTNRLHAKADLIAQAWEQICNHLKLDTDSTLTRHWKSPLNRDWHKHFYKLSRHLVLMQHYSDPAWQSTMRILAYFCKPDPWMMDHFSSARRLQTYLGDHYRVKHSEHSTRLLSARRALKRSRYFQESLEADLLRAFERKATELNLRVWATIESRPIQYHYFDRDVHLPYHDANFYAAFKLRSRVHQEGYSIFKLYHHHVHGSWPLQSEQDWRDFLSVWRAHYTYDGYVEEYRWNEANHAALSTPGWSPY